MNPNLNDDQNVAARLAQLQTKVDRLERRGRTTLARVVRMAGLILFASALGFGALTAAGVEAFHIDEAGNIHIMEAVTIGGATKVDSLAAKGAVSAESVTVTGAINSATINTSGDVNAGSFQTLGDMNAETVNSTQINTLNMASGTTTGNDLRVDKATIGGVIVDANGNVAIPGNLAVAGLSDRQVFKSTTMGTTTFIPAENVARFCADEDGCEMRLSMSNYDTVSSAPASVIGWLFCDANCKNWRVNSRSGDNKGTDNNNVTQHVLVGWACYFTDGRYSGVADQGDTEAGFGVMTWDQYPNSNCTLTLID